MLSWEFQQFYNNWLHKADSYNTDDLTDCFDKFFTLFVLYNRLYAETTFELARVGKINLSNHKYFPDSKAATCYIKQFLGANAILDCINSNPSSHCALSNIISLIEAERFHILLHLITGEGQRKKDIELLESLRSTNPDLKAGAILQLIYSIRCNLFHGHKSFEGVQKEIVVPVLVILHNIVVCLYNKLNAALTHG